MILSDGKGNKIALAQNDGLYSLTDIWKASGLGNDKKPAQWLRWKPAKEFVNYISQSVDTHLEKHVKIVRGGGKPGTFAHWQIALAYQNQFCRLGRKMD